MFHRPEADAKVELRFVKSRAKNCIHPDHSGFRRLPQLADAVRGQIHPTSDESMDLAGDLEVFAQDALEAFGIARLAAEPPRKVKLRPVLDGIARLQAFGAHS